MRYEILGPIRVVDNGISSFISARKIEMLLTALLVRADQIVPAEALITELWGDRAPRRATDALYVYVCQLRKFLKRPGRKESPIVTQPPGYLLHLGVDELDLHKFLQLTAEGREHARTERVQPAADCFQRALALLRGPTSANSRSGPIVDGFLTWLAEAHLECIEMLVDAQLSAGRHRELVGRLYALISEHPLHEAFHRQLMLALYRSDRQADALNAYQAARSILNNELGLEPCRALRDLQQTILRADDTANLGQNNNRLARAM